MKKYLSADFERMLGLRFVLCVAGVFLIFMTSTYTDRGLFNITALNAVDNGLYGMSGLFSMVVCAAYRVSFFTFYNGAWRTVLWILCKCGRRWLVFSR